jgi:tetratricopeptide (TPR) repeat protein
MIGLRLLLVCALVGGVSRIGAADEDPDTEMARRHFDTGAAAYEAGRYAEAAAEFERARKVQPLPAFDFNLGRAYDRMERPAEAIVANERYLRHRPTPPDAVEVRARIAVLRAREATVAPVGPRDANIPKTTDGNVAIRYP